MVATLKPRKRAVNLSIDARLAAEAKSFGTNLSATLEKALHQEHSDKRAEKWRKDNREAVEAWNKLVEEDGLWIDKYRGK
jgi:antitoxin CcdA